MPSLSVSYLHEFPKHYFSSFDKIITEKGEINKSIVQEKHNVVALFFRTDILELLLTTLWADSADDKSIRCFLIFPVKYD